MRQFDVYENPSVRSRPAIPYVAVLQSHYFDGAPTVIVAPLIIDDGSPTYTEASVEVELREVRYIVSVPELVAIDRNGLKRTVGNLATYEDAIRRAIERVFSGF